MVAAPEHPADAPGLLAQLPAALGPLPRSIRRAVRATFPHQVLPDAQADLLRTVEARPGLRVGDAAASLGLAPNTVSTLVRDLTAAGLVDRRRSRGDHRTSELHLTPAALDLLAEWGRHRTQVLRDVVADLPAADVEALAAALPALVRLRVALEARAGG